LRRQQPPNQHLISEAIDDYLRKSAEQPFWIEPPLCPRQPPRNPENQTLRIVNVRSGGPARTSNPPYWWQFCGFGGISECSCPEEPLLFRFAQSPTKVRTRPSNGGVTTGDPLPIVNEPETVYMGVVRDFACSCYLPARASPRQRSIRTEGCAMVVWPRTPTGVFKGGQIWLKVQ
jgi:hypothetical protein